MLYLNTRHRLPQIAIRQEWGKYGSCAAVPATVHTNDRQAKSNKGILQSAIEINNYPSRKAYGARNNTDYSLERGKKGLQDVQSAISAKMQTALAHATEGAKRGNDISSRAKSEMLSEYKSAEIVFSFELMAEPEITATEAEVVGEPDEGDVTAEIEPVNSPKVEYTPGSAETYLADKGFIRHWVTENHYDIYA